MGKTCGCDNTEMEQHNLKNLQEAENIQKNVESLIDLIKTDGKNYSIHIQKAQNIQKNIESLIEFTLKIQSGDRGNVAEVESEDGAVSKPTAMEDADEEDGKPEKEPVKVEEPKKPSGDFTANDGG